MQRRVAAYLCVIFIAWPMSGAGAASLPEIKTSTKNVVPACATPGRMMNYVKSRNPELDPRYGGVATEYMRLGEALGVRWDFAFYQMMIETGSLSYRRGNRAGDVKPQQNNFAGLGATGGGVPGESFKDIPTGVRAHLEHLLLYSGEKVERPTAERTRKVQEWGVLTSWQAHFTRPITFSDLAQQWAPGSSSYVKMLEAIADRFAEFCAQPDPHPELVAEARGRKGKEAVASIPIETPTERPVGTELARRAIEDGKVEENGRRSALGVLEGEKQQPLPFKLLNAPATVPTADGERAPAASPGLEPTASGTTLGASAASEPRAKSKEAKSSPLTATVGAGMGLAANKATPAERAPVRTAAAVTAIKPPLPPPSPAAGQKCRVWTASYGGQRALIIRSIVDKVVNYTVLDVNEGAEKREADAFIAAYAKDGAVAGEFASQTQALDKAFELCPEG